MITFALHLHRWRRPAIRGTHEAVSVVLGMATLTLSRHPLMPRACGLEPEPQFTPVLVEMSAWAGAGERSLKNFERGGPS